MVVADLRGAAPDRAPDPVMLCKVVAGDLEVAQGPVLPERQAQGRGRQQRIAIVNEPDMHDTVSRLDHHVQASVGTLDHRQAGQRGGGHQHEGRQGQLAARVGSAATCRVHGSD